MIQILSCVPALTLNHQTQLNITSNSNMMSFFPFVNKRAIYRLGIISLAYAPCHVTDFFVINVLVDELLSSRIWQHKLCATLFANVKINYRLSNQSIPPYLSCQTYQIRNNAWKPECALSFNMGWQDISKCYPSLPIWIKY